MAKLDDDTLATLSAEERAAMEAEDTPEEKLVMRQGHKDEAKDGEDEGDADDDDKDGADVDDDEKDGDEEKSDKDGEGDDDKGDGEGEGGDKAKPDDTDTGKKDPEDDTPGPRDAPAPRYEAKLPEDYDAKLATIKEKDAELRAQFKAGTIDIDARDAGLAELQDQKDALLVARTKAEVSQEFNQQSAANAWQNTVNNFIVRTAKQDGGIDYRKDAEKNQDLDTFVKALAKKEENADKPMEWFLVEADKRVRALHGITGKAPAAAPAAAAPATPADPAKKKETVKDAVEKRKPPVAAAAGKSLAQVPGGDGPGDVESEFADIDRLEGQAYEDALAKMSPAQRDKYLAG